MLPLVGLTSPIAALPSVVFPEPLSPTRARISPRPRRRETPSTALMTSSFSSSLFLVKKTLTSSIRITVSVSALV